jgi:ubiquinone/menaquinone biosynthesis C-methylase UbiE
MSLRTEYDVWHQRVFESDPEHEDASSPWYQLVREKIGGVAGLRVLEVACGRGGFVRELARGGAQATGCDFSFSALRVAGRKTAEPSNDSAVGLVHGDVQRLPFADDSFDLIVSCETIEHVPDVRLAILEMHRVTRPGGKLFLTTPNYLNLTGLYELYARARRGARRDDQPFDRRQWFPQIRRWIGGAGWKILGTDGTVHQFPVLPGRSPVRLEGIESNRTVRRLLSPFSLHYFVVAQKRALE